jgi:uroporphyrinogen decarboxylase
MYTRPELLRGLLDKLALAVSDFLTAQIEAGADVIQIFDSWAGMLTPDAFKSFSLPYLEKVVQRVGNKNAPVIVFARDAGHAFSELSRLGADVLGVSWSEDLLVARNQVGSKVALQGNLDPCVLFAPVDEIRRQVMKVLQNAGAHGHIFNLGHGILPETPVAHTRAMVDMVKEESARLPR